MTSRFERFIEGGYAEELEENGYPGKAAVLRALVNSWREEGMPEDFAGGRERLKELRGKLVEVLSVVGYEQGKPILTYELALAVNKRVGQYLPDDARIEDFILPTKSKYDYPPSVEGFEQSDQVNTFVKAYYNRALRQFVRAKYESLGEIRDTDESRMWRSRNIGLTISSFVKTAFARPQNSEG